MDTMQDSGQQTGQQKRRGRPPKVEHRRARVYGAGVVYVGKLLGEYGFTGELVPIVTPEAVLLVRPGTSARTLRRCIEIAALRMIAEEECGPEAVGESVSQVVRLVMDRLNLLSMEMEVVREAMGERTLQSEGASATVMAKAPRGEGSL